MTSVSKCFGIYFANNNGEKIITDLSQFGFFSRNRVRELIYASAKEILKRTENNSILDIELEFDTTIYLVGSIFNCGSALIYTTEKKPHNHLIALSRYIALNGPSTTIESNYEIIKSNIKIKQIHDEIAEIKHIMLDNIDKILLRQDKLEELLIKTEYLTDASKKYYQSAKKLNRRCCAII